MNQLGFITSAVAPEGYPNLPLPEVALVGRSNAGKSSFINSLTMSKWAYVSQRPGKTALINFFKLSPKLIIVDLPGYGYAQRSFVEREEWKNMIETYLSQRETLKGLLLIMDISRSWSDEEEMILRFARQQDIDLAIIATKTDKLGANELRQKLKNLIDQSGITEVFPVSNRLGHGVKAVEKFIYATWAVGGK